ncbi:MAG: aldo/keto reductase, partial [Clostridia bacterium]|nr:aldo/keto reductase [Clostridia bacterium]
IEHALKWKAQGKIKHLGFSFHSSAKLLDRILTEHPEFEFVQIAANYVDWNSQLVQAGPCYEVIRRHGKPVIMMEPVKGGGLAMVPEAVEKALKAKAPERSVASWAIRFGGTLDGLQCVLSGMSTLEQVKDNIHSYQTLDPLSEVDMKWLREDVNRLYRAQGPVPELSKYRGTDALRRAGDGHHGGLQRVSAPARSRLLRRQQLSAERRGRSIPPRLQGGPAAADAGHLQWRGRDGRGLSRL